MKQSGLADGGMYHNDQPAAQTRFRDNTGKQAVCAGVATPSFRCAKCRQHKLAKGRKMVTPGYPKAGYICLACQ